MKYISLLFFAIIYSGCNTNSENTDATHDSGKSVSINYPLPKSTDSLFTLLHVLPNDSNKVNVLNLLARKLMYMNPDTSILLDSEALSISRKIGWKVGEGNSLGDLGIYNHMESNYAGALDCYAKALKITMEIGYENRTAKVLGNIGYVYSDQADYPKALDYYFKALTIDERIKDEYGIARILGNIGIVYDEQENYSKANEYYFKALKLDTELAAEQLTANTIGNIGICFSNQENYKKALEYYFKAIEIHKKIGDNNGLATDFGSIGNAYYDLGDYPNAFDFYSKALKMDVELENKNNEAIWRGSIAKVFIRQKKFTDAYDHIYDALAISDSIESKGNLKFLYEMLSMLYERSAIPLPDSIGGKILNMEQMRLRSLHYFKSYVNVRDSIFSQENKKQLVRKEMNFVFEKKEAATKAENDKKEALGNEQLKQKENERNYFIAGFGLVLLLAGFIFRSYRQKQKANEIISLQKSLVEEKQKEILDSIHYAKRIQQSLLPTEKYMMKNLNRLGKK